MKTLIASLLILATIGVFALTGPASTSVTEKKDSIKVVANINGKTIMLDTVLSFTDNLSEEKINEILKNLNIDISDIDKNTANISCKMHGHQAMIKIIEMNNDSMIDQVNLCGQWNTDTALHCCLKIDNTTSCSHTNCSGMKGNGHGHKNCQGQAIQIDIDKAKGASKCIINGEEIDLTEIINKAMECCLSGQKKNACMKIVAKINTVEGDEKTEGIEKDEFKQMLNNGTLNIENWQVTPNPTKGNLNVSFNLAESGNLMIKIYDMNGKVIFQENIQQFTGQYQRNIDVSSQPKGIYFMVVEQQSKVKAKKIIIE